MKIQNIAFTICLAVFLTLPGCSSGAGESPNSKSITDEARLDAELSQKQDQLATIRTENSDALTYAPEGLKKILDQHESPIDFRYVTDDGFPYEGCHWRMKYTDQLLKAHVKQFQLEPTTEKRLTEKMLCKFPDDWPNIKKAKLRWYAWPYNRDDGQHLQLWSVMAIDDGEKLLYFFHQNYDVTP